MVIYLGLYLVAFTAPWIWLTQGEYNILWTEIGIGAMRAGIADFGVVTECLTAAAVVCAVAGAVLRVWGTAYLGSEVVHDSAMHTGSNTTGVVADGPYRHVRNPLYLGSMLNMLALTLLMPVSGAVFAVVTIVFFTLRLIGGEEAFLTAKLGAPYLEYKKRVPRWWPSLLPRVPASGGKAHWLKAVPGEIFILGSAAAYLVVGAYALFAEEYKAHLLGRCLLIALGVSLVVRAFRKEAGPSAVSTAE
jgi:protein-S-isoprenylcysteine O-methyltransferase Ste14